MKIGDLIQCRRPDREQVGTVIEFPPALHHKEFQKVRVLTEEGMQDWIMQFCEVVNSNQENDKIEAGSAKEK